MDRSFWPQRTIPGDLLCPPAPRNSVCEVSGISDKYVTCAIGVKRKKGRGCSLGPSVRSDLDGIERPLDHPVCQLANYPRTCEPLQGSTSGEATVSWNPTFQTPSLFGTLLFEPQVPCLGPPVVPFLTLFWLGGFPRKKVGILILTSVLEDLGVVFVLLAPKRDNSSPGGENNTSTGCQKTPKWLWVWSFLLCHGPGLDPLFLLKGPRCEKGVRAFRRRRGLHAPEFVAAVYDRIRFGDSHDEAQDGSAVCLTDQERCSPHTQACAGTPVGIVDIVHVGKVSHGHN